MKDKLVTLSSLKPGDIYLQPESGYIILINVNGEIILGTLAHHAVRFHFWKDQLVEDRTRKVKLIGTLRNFDWSKFVEE